MCVPQIVTYAAVEKEMEHKGEQRYALVNHDSSVGTTAVGEKAHLRMKRRRTVKE